CISRSSSSVPTDDHDVPRSWRDMASPQLSAPERSFTLSAAARISETFQASWNCGFPYQLSTENVPGSSLNRTAPSRYSLSPQSSSSIWKFTGLGRLQRHPSLPCACIADLRDVARRSGWGERVGISHDEPTSFTFHGFDALLSW